MKRCYIAGPLTRGNVAVNEYLAVQAAERLRKAGFAPFCPHLFVEWEKIAPGATYEEWLAIDLAWLEVSDAVLRLPGESPGADRETAFAVSRGIPVFTDEMELVRHFGPQVGGLWCKHLARHNAYGSTRCFDCGAVV